MLLPPQRPAAPRRTSPTPEEEGDKLRRAGVGVSSGDHRRPARPGRALAATLVAAGGHGGRHRSFPLTQRQRSGRSPVGKDPGKVQQGDSEDPQKCAVMEGWGEARGRQQLRGRMRPAACRTSSEEDRGNGSQVAGSTRDGCPAGGRCQRRGGLAVSRFARLGSAEGEAAAGDRKRAATAARARTASPSRSHTAGPAAAAAAYLPRRPASFLPSPGPDCSGGVLHARL